MQSNDRLIAQNVSNISLSAIKDMAMRSARIEGAASLTWGVPSFRTPEHIRRAVAHELEADPEIGKYALPDGLPALRRAVVKAHAAATGVTVDADRNAMITAGNIQGLNALFHTLIDPGDEIIVTDPGFASHVQQIRLCGGKAVFWRLDESRGWRLDADALEGLISPRSKAVVLVNPANPTGNIFPEKSLRRVGEIARANGLMILIDDPYSPFTYENRARYFNLASLPELFDNIAYMFTFSKCYAMTGWRLAYMIVPEFLKRQALKVHDATIICAPRISQVAGLAALGQPPLHLKNFEAVLARRRNLICERLDRLSHVFEYVRPEGAYYVFPRILADHRSAQEFALDILEQAHVALTPGSAFGPGGEHHVRMAYCVCDEVIELAFDRLDSHFGR